MSTSPATPTSTSRFRRGLIGTIAVLAFACAGLGVASVLQGPRIQGAQLDLAAAVVAPASMRIVLDEAVAPLTDGSVTVVPGVPLTVQNDGDVVLVHFDEALDYDTVYHVTLKGVTAAAGGVRVDLTHSVRTPELQLTWLQRAQSGDRILFGSPGREPTTLFTATRIQDYLPIDASALLVITLDDAGASHASIVATDGTGNSEDLVLPGGEPGRIGVLELAGTDVLFTFTSIVPKGTTQLPRFDQTLFRIDLTGTHIPEPVDGLDGSALAVDTVIPVPGTTTAFVHTRGGDLVRYDPTADEPPTLVAKYAELIALAGDGHRVSVKDAFGPLIYDIDDGSETRVNPSPLADTGLVPFVADVVPLDDGRWIERAVVPNADFTAFDSFVAIDDGAAASLLFRTADADGSILDYEATSNGRYLIAEVSPGGESPDASDAYEVGARPRDVTLVVIDIDAGIVAAEWQGSHARW